MLSAFLSQPPNPTIVDGAPDCPDGYDEDTSLCTAGMYHTIISHSSLSLSLFTLHHITSIIDDGGHHSMCYAPFVRHIPHYMYFLQVNSKVDILMLLPFTNNSLKQPDNGPHPSMIHDNHSIDQ